MRGTIQLSNSSILMLGLCVLVGSLFTKICQDAPLGRAGRNGSP